MRRLAVALIVLVLSVPFVPGPAFAAGRDVQVQALGTAFTPAVVDATLLDKVVWTNAESTESGVRHTVTATSGEWTLNADLAPGGSVEFSFSTAGTYAYRCLRHAGMTGQVVVGKGEDAAITTRLDSPGANESGVIPVTGLVTFRGTVVSPDEPVTLVSYRSADYAPMTVTVPLTATHDASQDKTVTRFDTVNWTSATVDHQVRGLSGPAGSGWTDVDVTVPAGGHFAYRFPTEGTYTYRCDLHPATPVRTITVATPSFTGWEEASLEPGAWRAEIDFNALPQGARRYYEVRAETERAYQKVPTGFVVQAAHAAFDISLLDADGVDILDDAVLSGNVSLAFRIEHPIWTPDRVEVKIWNTKAADGKPYYTAGNLGAPEQQTLSSSGAGAQLVHQGGGIYKIAPGQTAKYYPSGKWATSVVPDGNYDIVVKAVVPAGATTTMTREQTFRVVLDNRLDVIDATGARRYRDLGVVAGDVPLSGTLDPDPEDPNAVRVSGVEYAVVPCATRWSTPAGWTVADFTAATRVWAFTYPTGAIATGESCLDVRTVPGSGKYPPDGRNFTRLRYRMEVRNTPTVGFDAPAAGATVGGVVTFAGPATTPSHPIDTLEVKVDAGAFVLASDPVDGRWSYDLATAPLTNAAHTFTVRATTTAGHSATATHAITVSNLVTVAITSPAASATVSGPVVLAGTVSTTGYGLQKVEVKIDAGSNAPATVNGGAWTFALDTTTLNNAAHTMTVTATALDGRTSVATRSFTVANTPTKDLRVTLDAPAAPTPASVATGVIIAGRVHNDGNEKVAAANADLRIEYLEGETWRLVTAGAAPSGEVPGYGSVPFTFTWNRPATEVLVGTFPIRVMVDANDEVTGELAEGNNNATGEATWVTAREPARVAPDAAQAAAAALQACATGTPDFDNADARPVCEQVSAARNASAGSGATVDAVNACIADPETEAPEDDAVAGAVCQALLAADAVSGTPTAVLACVNEDEGSGDTDDANAKTVCDALQDARDQAASAQTTVDAVQACQADPTVTPPEGDVAAESACGAFVAAADLQTLAGDTAAAVQARATAAATALAACAPAGTSTDNADARLVCDRFRDANETIADATFIATLVRGCIEEPASAGSEGRDPVASRICLLIATVHGAQPDPVEVQATATDAAACAQGQPGPRAAAVCQARSDVLGAVDDANATARAVAGCATGAEGASDATAETVCPTIRAANATASAVEDCVTEEAAPPADDAVASAACGALAAARTATAGPLAAVEDLRTCLGGEAVEGDAQQVCDAVDLVAAAPEAVPACLDADPDNDVAGFEALCGAAGTAQALASTDPACLTPSPDDDLAGSAPVCEARATVADAPAGLQACANDDPEDDAEGFDCTTFDQAREVVDGVDPAPVLAMASAVVACVVTEGAPDVAGFEPVCGAPEQAEILVEDLVPEDEGGASAVPLATVLP